MNYRETLDKIIEKWGEGIMSQADIRDCVKDLESLLQTAKRESYEAGAVAMHKWCYDGSPFEKELNSSVRHVMKEYLNTIDKEQDDC